MGIVKQMQLEENSTHVFECPTCGDEVSCSEEDFEYYVEILGQCQYCDHVFNKDD